MRLLLALGFLLVATPLRAEPVTFVGPDGITLKAELHRPGGVAKTPAVVALHGCGGPFAARDAQWAEALTRAGHIVLFPDSFGSRGLGSQCRERNRVATSSGLRRRDAIAAAAWLAAQPGTPPGGVALLGWSDGGSTVLATARGRDDLPPGLIRGFIAFYPGCRGAAATRGWQPAAPLTILMGTADDWTPIAPCRALAAQAANVTLIAYDGAYHDFDAPTPVRVLKNIPTSQNADGSVHAGGDRAAREAALMRVPAILAGMPVAR